MNSFKGGRDKDTHRNTSHILAALRVRLDVVNQRASDEGRVGVQDGFLGSVDDDTGSRGFDLDVRVENPSRARILKGNVDLAGDLVVGVVEEDASEEVATRTSDADDEECGAGRD